MSRCTESMMALSICVSGEKLSLKSSLIDSVSANCTGSTGSGSSLGSMGSKSATMGGTISVSSTWLRFMYSHRAFLNSSGV